MQRFITISCLVTLTVGPATAQPEKQAVSQIIPGVINAPHMVPHAPAVNARRNYKDLAQSAYPRTHYQRGLYFRQKGDLNGALIEFLKATQENPRLVKAFYEQALIFHQRGYLKLAASSLEQALAVDPNFQHARVLLATISLEQGNIGGAVSELSRSLGLNQNKHDSASADSQSNPANAQAQVKQESLPPTGRKIPPPGLLQVFHDVLPLPPSSPTPPPPRQTTRTEPERTGRAVSSSVELTRKQAPTLDNLLKGIPGIDPDVPVGTTAKNQANRSQSDTSASGTLNVDRSGPRSSHRTGPTGSERYLKGDRHGSAAAPKASGAGSLLHLHLPNLFPHSGENRSPESQQDKRDETAGRSATARSEPARQDERRKAHAGGRHWLSFAHVFGHNAGIDPGAEKQKPPADKPNKDSVRLLSKADKLGHKAKKFENKAEKLKNKADKLGLAAADNHGKKKQKIAQQPSASQAPAPEAMKPAPKELAGAVSRKKPGRKHWFGGLFSIFKEETAAPADAREKDRKIASSHQKASRELTPRNADNVDMVLRQPPPVSAPQSIQSEQPTRQAMTAATVNPGEAVSRTKPPARTQIPSSPQPSRQTALAFAPTPRTQPPVSQLQAQPDSSQMEVNDGAPGAAYQPEAAMPESEAPAATAPLSAEKGMRAQAAQAFGWPSVPPSQMRWLSWPQPATSSARTTSKKSAGADEDSWTRRLRYLSEHGTATLKLGEAFMFSEETGEAVLFIPNGEPIRRRIAAPQDAEEVVRVRRPDILKPQELQYNLSLLGKLLPRQPEPEAAPKPAPQTDPLAAFSVNDVLKYSRSFWDWLRQSIRL